jgi:hypothetical protein
LISSVLTTTALTAPKSVQPVPSPNVRISTLSEEIYPWTEYIFDAFNDDTAALNILKLFAIEETVETRDGVEIKPNVPNPMIVLVNVALEM